MQKLIRPFFMLCVLPLALSACDKKDSVGLSQPPPPAPQPAPAPPAEEGRGGVPGETVPAQDGSSNGGVNGPTEIPAPTPKPADRRRPEPKPKPVTPRADEPAPLPPVSSGKDGATPQPVPAETQEEPTPIEEKGSAPEDGVTQDVVEKPPVDIPAALALWAPPDVLDTPAEAWLFYNIDPMLRTIQVANPPAMPLRRMKITIALGYFDGSHDRPLVYGGIDYGLHAPEDPYLRAALENVVERRCALNRRLQLCGFDLIKRDGVQSLYRRVGVDNVIQELRIFSGAYGERHEINVGVSAEIQDRRSRAAEQLFGMSFRDSDFVIYVGHARLGGGPDFRPPLLNDRGRVDYPTYQREQVGIKRTLKAVKQEGRRARAFAVLACDSTDLFRDQIRRVAPDMELVSSQGTVKGEDLTAAAVGAAEHFLRVGHVQGLKGFVSGQPRVSQFLTVQGPRP